MKDQKLITIPYEEYQELQRYRDQVENQRVIAIFDTFKFEGDCYLYWLNFESEEGLEAYMLYKESLSSDTVLLGYDQKVHPYWKIAAIVFGFAFIISIL